MIELTFLKELVLIKQVHQRSAILIIIGIFLDKGFKFQHFVYNDCHNVLMMSMNLGNIAI